MTAEALLITRPEPQGPDFARRALARIGARRVVLSPLLRIERVAGLPALPDDAEIVLTSASGLAVLDGPDRARLAGRRAWCVGPRTTAAARAAGMLAEQAGADAQSLAVTLADRGPGAALVHLRGVHAAAPLADWLSQSGIALREAVVYDQALCPLTDEARAILVAPDPVLVPLFSPRSAAAFAEQALPLEPRAALAVCALSPAVAEACAGLPVARLSIAPRPDASGMIDALAAIVAG